MTSIRCFICSVAIFFITVIWAFIQSKKAYRKNRFWKPIHILLGGIFLSSLVWCIALYSEDVSGLVTWIDYPRVLGLSAQHAARFFALDGEFWDLASRASVWDEPLEEYYVSFGVLLHVVAPALTFSFILSFFKNADAHRRYLFSFYKHTHVFSELNDKSLALARSIVAADEGERGFRFFSRTLIVFTDVLDQEDEQSIELAEDAKELGAILFRKDLTSIRYRRRYSSRPLSVYLISEDEPEKIRHASDIMDNYDLENVELFVFSEDIRSELLLATRRVKAIKVLRVNDIQARIYHNLDEHGIRLFRNARTDENGDRVVSAVLVGLGRYGLEALKALTWFCQMDGYRVKIHAFDVNKDTLSRFRARYPELLDDALNGKRIPGEARYEIHLHQKTDVTTEEFENEFRSFTDATYVLVALGEDDKNLSTAVRLRSIIENVTYHGAAPGEDWKPDVETVIYDSYVCESMSAVWRNGNAVPETGVTNAFGQHYGIHMFGGLSDFYSTNTVINSELVARAREVNRRWAQENAPEEIEEEDRKFTQFEYNYRSSITKAIHERLRKRLKDETGLEIPGVDVPRDDILADERLCREVGRIEHIRWNAYMRTDGYSHGKKNHLAKRHNKLVPVTELLDEDLRKDV